MVSQKDESLVTEATQCGHRVERASYSSSYNGPRWQVYNSDGKNDYCKVSQLLACLKYNPHEVFREDTVIHHRNGRNWDNRIENVEVLTNSEHVSYHRQVEGENESLPPVEPEPNTEKRDAENAQTLTSDEMNQEQEPELHQCPVSGCSRTALSKHVIRKHANSNDHHEGIRVNADFEVVSEQSDPRVFGDFGWEWSRSSEDSEREEDEEEGIVLETCPVDECDYLSTVQNVVRHLHASHDPGHKELTEPVEIHALVNGIQPASVCDWGEEEEYPWRDEATLRRMYEEQEKSMREIGDEFGVDYTTVRNWMERHGIERRNQAEAASDANRVEWASYCIREGRPEWSSWNPKTGSEDQCSVSQLLACLENNPHDVFADNMHVHHRNGREFDNRIENLEVLTRSDHVSYHNRIRREEESLPSVEPNHR